MSTPRRQTDTDPWQQRIFFLGLLDTRLAQIVARHTSSGITEEEALAMAYREIAGALGLKSTASLVHSYRYDLGRMPKRQVMEKAAPFFGVHLWQIYGPKPEITEKDELELANQMLEGAMGTDRISRLTDMEKIAAYRAAVAMAERVLAP